VSTLFKRIDTVFLHVKHFDQAIEWYVENLGFTLRWRHDESGYAALNIGETPLTLVRTKEGTELHDSEHAQFNFFTSNIKEAHRQLKERGVDVEPIQDHGDVLSFDFKDLDGNRLGVCHFQE
jgi:catechol 2,3-dioxygenase-like lactoylglutathione lyase family enzyme